MSFKIGFIADDSKKSINNNTTVAASTQSAPKRSLVQVHFPARGLTCAYYNDAFDLHRGDIVYVDGKLEGFRGRVVDVSYTFKIRVRDYQRVIGKANTNITGKLHIAGSHLVSFEPHVIPFDKVLSWFKAPCDPEDEYVSESDNQSFPLNDLSRMNIKPHIAERGEEYYMENKVVYISVSDTQGYAIVEGSEPYEVEFTYQNGDISNLVCSCFCSYTCKHEFAAMLQLRETLKNIEQTYLDQYATSSYFAAIAKTTLFSFVIDSKENGSIILG